MIGLKCKTLLLALCLIIILPITLESAALVPQRIIDNGYMGKGNRDWDSYLNRAELATISIRLLDLENETKNYKGPIPFKDVENFQNGWATPYIALAHRENLVRGINPTTFNPKGEVSYIEMLTVFMRILGYQDGIDFVDYPEDYYTKAISIDLAQVYIDTNEKVTRKDVAFAIEKLLDLPMKNENILLIEKLNEKPKTIIKENIKMTNITFNTAITGLFAGQLIGREDFTHYKVELLSKEDKYKKFEKYGETTVEKDGSFKILGFDTGFVAKNRGYRYKVYNGDGDLVLEGNL